jgi:citrate lyase beta subunit
VDLTTDSLAPIMERLARANETLARAYPGETGARQPVHTVYGGAHLFRGVSASKLGELALRSLDTYGPNAAEFAEAIGLAGDGGLHGRIYERVRAKLEREPVEDFRIDFEDGYGNRPGDEEDACARQAAREVATGMDEGTLPPFVGIRIKPLSGELHRRAIRTLDLFVSALLEQTAGRLPDNFVVTLPKVMIPEQVAAAADVMTHIESRTGLAQGSLRVELMIETTQSIIGADGVCPLPALVAAAGGRCVAAHFGVYDYTAGCGVTAQHQHMTHPVCDFARHVMQVALGGTGIMLSDGATNVMPVAAGGASVTEQRRVVHRAWRLHFEDVRHSLRHGYYQGWDLHPAQLPTRYAAAYSFFLESLDSASRRLRNFIDQAARATLLGDVFDDAATGQGLLNFFLRGLNCGALTEAEALSSGLTIEELRSRSFVMILEGRSG